MTDYSAGDVEHNGVKVPIFVNDQGDWLAELAGHTVRRGTRDKLEEAVKRITKRTATKVAIPFVEIDKAARKYRYGTATGIHGGNGSVLVTWENGDKAQYRGSHFQTETLRDVPEPEMAEWQRLATAAREAVEAVQQFVYDRKIDLKDAVTEAADSAPEV